VGTLQFIPKSWHIDWLRGDDRIIVL